MDPDDDHISFPLSVPDPIENPVQPALPVPLGFPVIVPGSDDWYDNEWLSSVSFLPENPVQPAHSVPLAFPVIAPGSADSREAAVDINVYSCIHGHAFFFLLRETAESLGAEMIGELRSCTGISMAEGYRKPIANSSKSRATQSWEALALTSVALRVLIRCLVRRTYSNERRQSSLYFLERKSDTADAFRKVLADVRADSATSEVERVRSENGGELFVEDFGDVCRQFCIKWDFTNTKSPG